MKNIFQTSRVIMVMMLSVFLFSCDKSEMDDLMPATQTEEKKANAPGQQNKPTQQTTTQTADSIYIVTFNDLNNQLQTEQDVQNLATSIAGSIAFEWTWVESTKGFSAPLTLNQANSFRNDSRVEFVENDGPIYPVNP